jgi:hypothetical protein
MNPKSDSSPLTPTCLLSRRAALKTLGMGALGVSAFRYLSTPAFAATGTNIDADVLNFALNLEYLEAEYYTYATKGHSISAEGVGITGAGTLGPVTIKPNPVVPFSSATTRQQAEEIAEDERAHVKFLRAALTAASVTPVARPAIDLRDSFMDAAAAAGLGEGFDPFASETNFLLGAFIFEDVGVTAYKGAAPLLTDKGYLEAAAGILAVEAYHAGSLRHTIWAKGEAARLAANKISDLRDAVDGASDDDQGVTKGGKINMVPADANGIAYSRTPRQVLNIVYLGVNATSGGFFPHGMNGAIK